MASADKNNKNNMHKKSKKDSENVPKPDSDFKTVDPKHIEEINKMIKRAIASARQDREKEIPETEQARLNNFNIIRNFLEQYLNGFIILGYDIEGDPLALIHAATQQQADSLSTCITRFIMNNNSSHQGPFPPNMPPMGPPGPDWLQ